jgi:UDP-glucose 4-epimerase
LSQQLNILITGGAGFIGSHLCDLLLAAGHRVTVLDDLSTGAFANLSQHDGSDRFELIIDSVLKERLVEELVRKCDRVFHLASAVGVKLIMDQPVKTIETIFGGTDVVLRCCARFRKRVLVTSTSEVYGKGVAVPFREDDDVLTGATSKHRWAYACAKALDEFLALAHYKETRLPVAIARLFNTVGPRQQGHYGMVVPRFVAAALKHEPLIVHGDGEQTRSFAHVLDVAAALVRLLETPACFGKVVNIGNDIEVTINELARTAIRLTNSRSEIIHTPYDQVYGEGFEDMRRRVPSLDRARELIGYSPSRGLDAIIQDVAQYLAATHR